jgi:hypothetical protein
MPANLLGVSYKSAPRRFRGTRSTILDYEDFLTKLLRYAVQYSTGAPFRAGMARALAYSCSTTLKREVLI